jgi:hypothetical protein
MVFDLKKAIQENTDPKQHQLVVFLVPRNNDTQLYQSFKKVCCNELGLPSQAIRQMHLDPNKQGKLNSILTKVAAQMNCKLGGELWDADFKVNLVKFI